MIKKKLFRKSVENFIRCSIFFYFLINGFIYSKYKYLHRFNYEFDSTLWIIKL